MYHPANARHTPYALWRVWLLALVGYVLGIQFKIVGMPFGASYDKPMWDAWWGKQNSASPLK